MSEKIKILIVDDNESTRDGTARLLEYEDNIEIVGFGEDGATAIERVKELSPHVVLMDINMPVMNGIDATAQISQIAPRTRVIMVSVQDDSQYLKQAFRAGAVDFVAKPITSAELAQAIERAYSQIPAESAAPPMQQQQTMMMPQQAPGGGWMMQMPPREGHAIGVLGFKGGMGKTTVAVNLAVGLAQAGKKTVLVDGSTVFGDVSLFLNTRAQHNIVDIANIAMDPEQVDEETLAQAMAQHESGLKLLVAPANPSESEPIPGEGMTNLINLLKRDFEFVVIDTSVQLDELLLAVINTSERLLVLATPTMPSLKDARILFGELAQLEYSMDKVMLILNQIDKTSRITADQITNFLKRPVALQIPFDLTTIEAVNQGVPLVSLDPRRAPSVKPMMDMVQLILSSFEVSAEQPVAEPPPQQQRRSGLFGFGG
jgi:pilus assembly protein CpaE